jgi:hypothetical protein
LDFGVVYIRRQMPMFRRNTLSPSSGLKWRCWEVETQTFPSSPIPSTSQHRHFSAEGGVSMFLRNVGIYLRIYSAKIQNRHPHRAQLKPQISHFTGPLFLFGVVSQTGTGKKISRLQNTETSVVMQAVLTDHRAGVAQSV